jgi:hypothetical protein
VADTVEQGMDYASQCDFDEEQVQKDLLNCNQSDAEMKVGGNNKEMGVSND